MKNHIKGEIFCSCGKCPHDNSFQCADVKCTCCVGSDGPPYQLHFLKGAGAPATNF